MKILKLVFVVCLVIFYYGSQAQPYWVVETNLRLKNFTIVKFFSADHRLIYEEKQLGVYFNPTRKRHKKRLDSMLENFLHSRSALAKQDAKQKEAEVSER